MAQIRFPINKQASIRFAHQVVHHKFPFVQAAAVLIGHFIGLILLQHTFGYQLLGIQGSGGGMLANNLIHQWLCR